MRQQFLDAAGRVGRQALEHVLQVDVWIEVVHLRRTDQAHDRLGMVRHLQLHSLEVYPSAFGAVLPYP